jgi:hypothetical protein
MFGGTWSHSAAIRQIAWPLVDSYLAAPDEDSRASRLPSVLKSMTICPRFVNNWSRRLPLAPGIMPCSISRAAGSRASLGNPIRLHMPCAATAKLGSHSRTGPRGRSRSRLQPGLLTVVINGHFLTPLRVSGTAKHSNAVEIHCDVSSSVDCDDATFSAQALQLVLHDFVHRSVE